MRFPEAGTAVERTAPAVPAEIPGFSAAEFTAKRRGVVRRYFHQHPRLTDLAVVLCYLLLAVPSVVMETAAGSYLHVVVCAVTAFLLFFRRYRPVTVTVVFAVLETVLLVLSPVGASVGLSLWFGLYAVAVRRRSLFAFITMALVSLPLAVVFLFFSHLPSLGLQGTSQDRPLIGLVSALVLLISNLVATGIGVSVRHGREHDDELRVWAERNARLASLTERNRIAREMHDVVAHSLTVMVALSDGAAVLLPRDPKRASTVLAELSRTGRTALADTRRVLGVLGQDSFPELAPLPAISTLGALLEGFRVAGLPVQLSTTGPELPVDPALQLTVYRIVQESLTNVLRYGRHVSRVGVDVRHSDPRIIVRIYDDGGGTAAPSLGAGQGIVGMKERASFYAGTVTAGPGANGGWLVEAVLQCPGAHGDEGATHD